MAGWAAVVGVLLLCFGSMAGPVMASLGVPPSRGPMCVMFVPIVVGFCLLIPATVVLAHGWAGCQ